MILSRVGSLHHRLLQRRCVACGFDDGPLGSPRFEQCPRCGCDFSERPPRSYAEMEGLVGQPVTIDAPMRNQYQQQRLFRRWVVFAFFSLAVLGSLVYLAVEVLRPI
jgi:hypothetical protein